jgi:hypothetical protein
MAPTITQTFNPAIGEYGQDYAVPVGTPIYSPVAGVFSSVDNGKQAWGKQAFVHLTTAIGGIATFAVGHLTSFAAVAGQKISVGQLIGYSGGAPSDPSSGNTTGPHVETQFYNAKGQPLNPVSVFAQFASWEQAIFSGKSSTSTAPSSSSSSTSGNPYAWYDPRHYTWDAANAASTAGTDIAGAIAGTVAGPITRAFWIVLGLGLFALGIAMIFFDDFKGARESGADAIANAISSNQPTGSKGAAGAETAEAAPEAAAEDAAMVAA